MREVEKGFYLSFVAFVKCWLLVCREKNSLLQKSLLIPLVPILQSLLCTFFLRRERFSGLHPTGFSALPHSHIPKGQHEDRNS